MTWTRQEMDAVIKLYPRYGVRSELLGALPGRGAREIRQKAYYLGLHRIFKPKAPLLPVRTPHLRWYLLAQSYFIRRALTS